MPVDIQIIRACEFLRVGTHGEFHFDSTRSLLLGLADACRKRGTDRALIDVRGSTSNLTRNDLAQLAEAFSEAAASRKLRLAVLHAKQQSERAKLFAFFSAMRGRNVRAVESFEKAFDWLSAGEQSTANATNPESEVPIRRGKRSGVKIPVDGDASKS